MSFDWSEYLTLAQELASQSTGSSIQEARSRSAVSRAYYAAFRQARNYLRDREGKSHVELTQGNTHQNVIILFEELYHKSKNSKYRMIARFLRDLRSMRNKTDYNDNVQNLYGLTQIALIQAKDVITSLSTLSDSK